MDNISEKIALLEQKLQTAKFKQRRLEDEFYLLESELNTLKASLNSAPQEAKPLTIEPPVIEKKQQIRP